MATKQYQVAYYRTAIGDRMSASWGGVSMKARGYIVFYSTDGYRLIAYFLTSDSPVPDPTYIPANKVGAVFLPAEAMETWHTMALMEKPLYVYMNDANPQWNSVKTYNEPVGEEET